MSRLDPIKPYVDLIKLLAFAGICWFFFWIGGIRKENVCMAADLSLLNQALDARDEAIKQRNEAQKKADELAKLPPKVVERVRANPSGCSLAKPVADGLRDQVRKTNDAIPSAVR